MGRAKIENKIGEGKYRIEYLYNVELINFEIDRLTLRQSDIDPNELLKATQTLEEKETAVRDASDNLQVLLRQLRGEVSPAVVTQLDAALTALTSADSVLGDVAARRTAAGIALSASVDAFPSVPPPEVTAAYNAAFSALATAAFDVTGEQSDLNASSAATNTARNTAAGGNPDPDTVREQIQAARDTFADLLASNGILTGSLSTAASRTQAAKESLPSDSSWDTALAHAEAALFALNNSDEEAGALGAIPAHGQLAALYSSASTALKAAADLMTPGQEGTKKEVKEAVKALQEASTARDESRFALDQLYLELSQIEKRLEELDAIEQSKKIDVWCADYTTEIEEAKEIATIEVPGEYTEKGEKGEVLIRPGFHEAELPWNQARDGYNTPSQALTPAGWFYNLAMLPGWQVFRPTYRFAKVKTINEDGTLEIQLLIDDVSHRSSQQDIIIDPQPLPDPNNPTKDPDPVDYSNVPVEYMDCHASGFEVGDEVLVEYEGQKAEKPKVIGHRKDPRECAPVRFYTPREELRVPVNTWIRVEKIDAAYGNAYWTGRGGACSWFGYGGRHFQHSNDPLPGPWVFHLGQVVAVAPSKVRGAAIHKREGKKWLFVVCRDYDGTFGGIDRDDVFYAIPLDEVTTEWTLLHTQGYGDGVAPDGVNVTVNHFQSVWFWSQNGLKAVCVKRNLGDRPSAYEATQTRMVGFEVSFNEEGEPIGNFIWHPVRAYEDGSSTTFEEGCGALGILGTDCITDISTIGSSHRYDVHADWVRDELVTFDETTSGGSQNRIECGPLADCFQLADIRATTVVKTDSDTSSVRLVCSAFGFDELEFTTIVSLTTNYSQETTETDGMGNCASTVTEAASEVTTMAGHFPEFLDFQGGAGKVHFLYRDVSNAKTITAQQIRAYHIGSPVDITDSGDEVSSHASTAILNSAGVNTTLGALTVSPWPFTFDPNITGQLWAAADRKGHCIVSSEQFDKKIGNPVLPDNVLPTFETMGIG